MNTYSLTGRLLFPDGSIRYGWLKIENCKILDLAEGPLLDRENVGHIVELESDYLISPGFIDVQVNGGFGYEIKNNPEAVEVIRRELLNFGVTAFVPTITTLPLQKYEEALSWVRAISPDMKGADILGVHIEGPYLNPSKRGAHPLEHLREPAQERDTNWLHDPMIKMVTLAPELPGALDLIAELSSREMIVGLGHTEATCSQVLAALDRGAKWGTHLFNAMSIPDAREPGTAGTLLTEERAFAGIIADGLHVHPRMLQLAHRIKGSTLLLMTDSSAVTGMPPGRYTFGERVIVRDEHTARLPNGTVAGSVLTLDSAVRNMVEFGVTTIEIALQMVSSVPARLLGIYGRKGVLAPGADADIVILDSLLNPRATIVGGTVAFSRDLQQLLNISR